MVGFSKETLRSFFRILKTSREYLNLAPATFAKHILWYIRDFLEYIKKSDGKNFSKVIFYPCLQDKLSFTPVEPIYFFQDAWAARKIFELKPTLHVDLASSVKFASLISQFTPTVFVDIRPVPLKPPGFIPLKADITSLPFKSDSIKSLSSLCVLEHIGLGRYGDKIDPYGTEKAVEEVKRVMAYDGILLLSVPIDNENVLYFNAHRSFSRDYFISLFQDSFELLEEKYIWVGNKLWDSYNQSMRSATGLFMMKKKKRKF
ncbi:hypothetical protein HRbin19_00335 [bacterium HR19]|nr:hypothetical protein HRbin19_00335 [bacterium HR19]